MARGVDFGVADCFAGRCWAAQVPLHLRLPGCFDAVSAFGVEVFAHSQGKGAGLDRGGADDGHDHGPGDHALGRRYELCNNVAIVFTKNISNAGEREHVRKNKGAGYGVGDMCSDARVVQRDFFPDAEAGRLCNQAQADQLRFRQNRYGPGYPAAAVVALASFTSRG